MAKSTTPPYLNMIYDARLPCFKQGDDLAHSLRQHPDDVSAGFEAQARAYDECARLCRRLAGLAAEVPELEIQADTHMISVSGPHERLQALVTEGVLQPSPMDEEDREATEAAFTEQLLDAMDEKGFFMLDQAMTAVAGIDPELEGLNPAWVREVLDGMVTEGSLLSRNDEYRVRPE